MKQFTAYKLTHTLQTYLGMVMNNGEPRFRLDPCIPNYLIDTEEIQVSAKHPSLLSEEALVALFTSCVLDCRLPQFRNPNDPDVKRLKANIYGCCDTQIDIAFMKSNIGALLRLDLEQAAAVVISAIRNDDGEQIRNRAITSEGNQP